MKNEMAAGDDFISSCEAIIFLANMFCVPVLRRK